MTAPAAVQPAPSARFRRSAEGARTPGLDRPIYTFDPYEHVPWQDAVRAMHADGVRTFSWLVPLPLAWREEGGFDFAALDGLEDELAGLAPGSAWLPRVFLTTPDWWDRRHPEELLAFDGPPPGDKAFPNGHQKLWRYEAKMYHSRRNASLASARWRADAGGALAAYTAHLLARRGRAAVAGVMPAYGTCGEWNAFGSYINGQFGNGDFSRPMVETFRAFLRRRYGGDGELRRAWRRDDVTLAEALPPSKTERMRVERGNLRSPAHVRPLLDYTDHYAEIHVSAVAHFAARVKDVDAGLPVGVFGAGLMGAGASAYQLHNLAAARLYDGLTRLADVDFLSTPNGYFDRLRGMYSQAPVRSVLARTRFVGENDVRTHRGADMYSPAPDASRDQFLLETGFNLATSDRLWWYDFGRGWYRDDDVRRAVRGTFAAGLGRGRTPAQAAVAVVADPASVGVFEGGMGYYRQALATLARELPRAGQHADHIVLDDVYALPPYRVYIFRDLFLATPAEAARLRAFLRRHGATAVWLGPAGCVTPDAVDVAGAERLTGIPLVEIPGVAGPNAVTLRAEGHPLTRGLALPCSPAGVEDLNAVWAPALAAADAPGVEALGLLEAYDRTGLACRREGGRLDVWSASPLLPARFWRNLFGEAGAPARVEGDAAVYGAGPLWVVRADAAGDLRVRADADVEDLATGERWPVADGWATVPIMPGRTHWFRSVPDTPRRGA